MLRLITAKIINGFVNIQLAVVSRWYGVRITWALVKGNLGRAHELEEQYTEHKIRTGRQAALLYVKLCIAPKERYLAESLIKKTIDEMTAEIREESAVRKANISFVFHRLRSNDDQSS